MRRSRSDAHAGALLALFALVLVGMLLGEWRLVLYPALLSFGVRAAFGLFTAPLSAEGHVNVSPLQGNDLPPPHRCLDGEPHDGQNVWVSVGLGSFHDPRQFAGRVAAAVFARLGQCDGVRLDGSSQTSR
jgi:hypothetical protein